MNLSRLEGIVEESSSTWGADKLDAAALVIGSQDEQAVAAESTSIRVRRWPGMGRCELLGRRRGMDRPRPAGPSPAAGRPGRRDGSEFPPRPRARLRARDSEVARSSASVESSVSPTSFTTMPATAADPRMVLLRPELLDPVRKPLAIYMAGAANTRRRLHVLGPPLRRSRPLAR
jgi:hypothetical protein